MSVKSAAARIDWSGLSSKLRPETVASLAVFRRRHAELNKAVADLREQDIEIDFKHYTSVLKNKKVVAEAQKSISSFKPSSFDLAQQLKVIKEQEQKAVSFVDLGGFG